MIYTEELLDALVARLRLIPDWVTAMGGDATKIRAFKPSYPDANDADTAVYKMTPPGVLVMSMGGGPVDDGGVKHADTVVIHMKPVGSVLPILKLFRSHVGASGVRLENESITPYHYPMNAPQFEFTQDEEGQDVWHITTSFVEAGF